MRDMTRRYSHDLITFDNILKIATSKRDYYATACLLDYNYFRNYFKMITIDLRKLQALDADQKGIQESNKKLNAFQ